MMSPQVKRLKEALEIVGAENNSMFNNKLRVRFDRSSLRAESFVNVLSSDQVTRLKELDEYIHVESHYAEHCGHFSYAYC